MQDSWGVNQLTTSHTIEHLSSIYLHSWRHDKLNLYLIYHCLNKTDIALLRTSDKKKKKKKRKKKTFLILQKK